MNNVIIDSSVWIDFFTGRSPAAALTIDRHISDLSAAVCGLILSELLPMGRTQHERNEIEEYLRALTCLPDPPMLWENVIELKKAFRLRGISGIGIPDIILCAVALHNNCPIISSDAHFEKIRHAAPELRILST